MIGHKYTPTVGHTGSYAFGDYVRRNLGATVVELGIPPALAVGSVKVYYGVGFFGGIKWYTYDILTYETYGTYEFNIAEIFGDITAIINQGIVLASQSQLEEIALSDIWGYIILNGTDMLTVTVIVGYLVQKFMEQ